MSEVMKDETGQSTYELMPVIKRLLKELKADCPGQMGRTFVYTIAAGIFPIFGIILPKIAIGILEKNSETVEKELMIAMAIYAVVVALFAIVKNKLQYKINGVNMRSRVSNMSKVYAKLMRMDYCYVEDSSFWEKNSKAMNAFNNDYNGMEGMLNRLCLLPAKLLSLVLMVVMTCLLSPVLLVTLMAHVLVKMCISKSDHNYRYKRKEEQAKAERKIDYYRKTSQDFSFGKDIRIYNLRNRILDNYRSEVLIYRKLIKKCADHLYFMSFLELLAMLISDVAMYGILIYKVYHGMPISSFTMYVSLIAALSGSLVSVGEDFSFLRNEGQYMHDAYKFVDSNLCTEDKEKITFGKDEQIEIVFDHVDFKYPGTEKYIYKDLNFTIHKGESLAIVGVNGAGKSTLVKLMMGLFAPTAGHIYINGTDVNDFNKRDLYDIFSAVFQDVNVMAFPIRENVAGSTIHADDERVQKALESVGLWEKVKGFEKGLDTMMLKIIDENGTDFSGGERQKLSIARGLYKDAPMVVMDEPTAALDALAEAAIYESFSDMVQGKTAVYISHRLASTKFCDKIALFDNTGLLEYGTHEELMEKQGEYYHMFVVQGKYYQVNDENEEEIA